CLAPCEHVLVNTVDQRAIQIEQERRGRGSERGNGHVLYLLLGRCTTAWYILAANPRCSMPSQTPHGQTPRRRFLTRSMALAASVLAGRPRLALSADLATGEVNRRPGVKLKIGLNAYSFNRPLTSGKMTLE